MSAMMILCQKLYQKKTQKWTWILEFQGQKQHFCEASVFKFKLKNNCKVVWVRVEEKGGKWHYFGQRYLHIKELFFYGDILIILC